jgi:hypothetical protein
MNAVYLPEKTHAAFDGEEMTWVEPKEYRAIY